MLNKERRHLLHFMHIQAGAIPRLDWLDIAVPRTQNFARSSTLVQDDPNTELQSLRDIQGRFKVWEKLLVKKQTLRAQWPESQRGLKACARIPIIP